MSADVAASEQVGQGRFSHIHTHRVLTHPRELLRMALGTLGSLRALEII
jgi:hypothetical protein